MPLPPVIGRYDSLWRSNRWVSSSIKTIGNRQVVEILAEVLATLALRDICRDNTANR
jgi:hypothetical protein